MDLAQARDSLVGHAEEEPLPFDVHERQKALSTERADADAKAQLADKGMA